MVNRKIAARAALATSYHLPFTIHYLPEAYELSRKHSAAIRDTRTRANDPSVDVRTATHRVASRLAGNTCFGHRRDDCLLLLLSRTRKDNEFNRSSLRRTTYAIVFPYRWTDDGFAFGF